MKTERIHDEEALIYGMTSGRISQIYCFFSAAGKKIHFPCTDSNADSNTDSNARVWQYCRYIKYTQCRRNEIHCFPSHSVHCYKGTYYSLTIIGGAPKTPGSDGPDTSRPHAYVYIVLDQPTPTFLNVSGYRQGHEKIR